MNFFHATHSTSVSQNFVCYYMSINIKANGFFVFRIFINSFQSI